MRKMIASAAPPCSIRLLGNQNETIWSKNSFFERILCLVEQTQVVTWHRGQLPYRNMKEVSKYASPTQTVSSRNGHW